MKNISMPRMLIVMAALLLLCVNRSMAQTSFTTPGNYSYTVPSGVTQLYIEAAGARGGNAYSSGGSGGIVICTLAVSPSQVLNVNVGGAGTDVNYYSTGYGGFNGGGNNYYRAGAGGGGGTDIMISPYSVYDRVIVAGGGGGAGYDCGYGEWGGNGGDLYGQVGADCYSYYNGGYVGYGGTPYYGGNGGYYGGSSGYLGQGGDASGYGGGGGGGYYGGGGGYYGGAGGGSSYTDASLATDVQHYQGYNGGDGYVNITEVCSAGPVNGASDLCLGSVETLVPDVPGGTWTSDDNGIATVDYNTGDVTGVAKGATTITYTQNLPCGDVYTIFNIRIRKVPTSITGGPKICNGQVVNFSSTAGGNWTTSDNSVAVADFNTGDVTGVSVGTAILTYQIGTSCYVTKNISVIKTAPITGTANVCQGLVTTLASTVNGGTWSSNNASIASVNTTGDVTGGTTAGGTQILYTQANGCVITKNFTTKPLPAIFTGPSAVCNGYSITIGESTTGGTWSSGTTTVATVAVASTTSGTVKGISAGTSVITYKGTNTCIRTSTVTVNPLPAAIIAPSAICVTDASNPTATLSDATGTGAWSSNSTVAAVGSSTGILSGVAAGTATISYTLPVTGCYLTTFVTVNKTPGPITGTKLICANDISYLGDGDIGGTWTSSNTTMAKVDYGIGTMTGVAGYSTQQTPIITYTLLTGCKAVAAVSVNPAPPAITGSTGICAGSTVTWSTTAPGTWTSLIPGYATITAGPSTSADITGALAGSTSIQFSLSSTGCSSLTAITVNATPAAITPGYVTICPGSSISLNDGDAGGTWSTVSTLLAVDAGGSVTTTGTVAVPTTASIDYSFSTGCKATKEVTINTLPTVYNLASFTGASDYCDGGTGIDLYMNLTTSGVQYKLYKNSIPLPGFLPGSGAALHFGNQTAGGTYTVTAYDPSTGCSANMTGSPTINVNSLPDQYTVKYGGPSGGYCDGTSGVQVILDNSQSTVNYILVKDGTSGITTAGTGIALDFGILPEGVYTVIGEDATTHCTSNMLSSAVVVKNPLPSVHNVSASDSGYYCAGSAGAHVQLDYGDGGIDYQLFNGGPLPVTTVSGANAAVDFGVRTSGLYTVVAKNAITGCTQAMTGTVPVNSHALPPVHNITGGGKFCFGSAGSVIGVDKSDIGISYQLYNGTIPVGSAVAGLSSGAAISFAPTTATGPYTVVATNPLTNCSANMAGATTVIANPAIAAFNVTVEGTGSYCVGGPGLHIYLSGSSPFVKYDVVNRGIVVATKPTGTGAAIDFGLVTPDSFYTVVATDSTSIGCKATMNGNPFITINSLPKPFNVTVDNSGDYCAGGSGVSIGLAFSDAGVTYELYKNSVATGIKRPGATSSVDFGKYTAAAAYTIVGTNDGTHCSNNMTGSAVVRVNPLPVAYTMTGGGSYCIGGTGVPIGLFKSDVGINYQLFYAGTPFSGIVPGSGSALAFGKKTTTGIYSVVATDVETGCTSNMADTKVVTTDPLPVPYNVTGGGSYCAGGTGLAVGVDNSVTGVSYQLFNGTSPGTSITGTTGSPIDFGKQTAGGTYTVIATTIINTCKNIMNGNAMININLLPAVDTVKGGGPFCVGGPGADIYMANTQPGIYYTLYMGGSPVGSGPVLGGGTKADLGLQTIAGIYNVVAANAATGCTNNMAGTATVSANLKPNAYTITGGGTLCAGDAGYHIMLSGSQTDVSYDLYNSGSPTPVSMTGTGRALDFGEQTANGTYTIYATNSITTCANNMLGSGIVNVNPAPLPFTVTGGGSYCSGREGVSVDLAGSENGINYQLLNGGIATGTPVGGTGLAITFGMQKIKGTTYTVRATNTLTSCASDMTGSTSVVIDPIVTPAVTIKGTDGTACIGEPIHFYTEQLYGGTSPSFVWKVNGSAVSTDNTYDNIPANGDIVSVEMTSNANCLIIPKANNSLTISAVPYSTPTAVVATDPGNDICHGTPVRMTATTSFGGTTPGYYWLKNGAFVGSGTTFTYTPNSANDQDVITFMLRSYYHCRTSDTVFSDPVVMTVDSAVIPAFTITSSFGPKDDAVAVGQIDTFTAVMDTSKFYKRYNYTYQWYIQGTVVPGADQPVYIDHAVYNNDIVSCVVTKLGACGTQTGTEKTVVVLKNLGAQELVTISNVSVIPNPNKGEFTVKGTLGTKNDGDATLELTNMLGQSVYKSNVMIHGGNINEQVKLSNTLASGMYLLNLRSGTATTVFHVVIEQQ